MSSRVALGVLAGLVSALMFSTMMTGASFAIFAGYFAALPLFAVGLARGYLMAGVGGATGAIAIALVGGIVFSVPFLVGFAAPATVLVRQALLARTDGGSTEWYPAGRLVQWLGGLAIVLFGGTLIVIALGGASVSATLEDLVRHTVAQVQPTVAASLTPEAIAFTAALIPGLAAGSWMVMMAVNGTLAQAILARRQWNVRPRGDLAALTVPSTLAVVGAAAGLAAWQGDGLFALCAGLVAFVASIAYLFQGLAVVHTVSRGWTWRTPALVFFYFGLVLVYQIAVPAVVLLGVVEPWLGLRARLATGGGTEE